MFTLDDLTKLSGLTSRDDVISAVAQIPEEKLRQALIWVIMAGNKKYELELEMWRKQQDEIRQLKEEIARLKTE